MLYELHVKGFTQLHPEVPPHLRGTYAGLAHPVMIEHFKRLGVTTIELLPVQAFFDDRFLVAKGLRNHWGYQTSGFFAPEPRYGSTNPLRELQSTVMARALLVPLILTTPASDGRLVVMLRVPTMESYCS